MYLRNLWQAGRWKPVHSTSFGSSEIAYIAYGVLLTRGTVEHVVGESNLRTYTVSDGDLQELSNDL